MKITKGTKIEKCAAREQGRYRMENVLVRITEDSAEAITTNGCVLARIVLEREDSDVVGEHMISAKDWKEGTKKDCTLTIDDDGMASFMSKSNCFKCQIQTEGEFPRVDQVIPTKKTILTLDRKLLINILNAIDGEFIEVTMGESHSPIRLDSRDRGIDPNGNFGVLMPITKL